MRRWPLLHVLWALCLAVVLATAAGIEVALGLAPTYAILIGVGVGASVAGALGWWLAGRVSAPLNHWSAAADSASREPLELHAPPTVILELHRLGGSLRALSQSLQRALTALLDERTRTQAILGSMAEGVIALDADHRILVMNPAAAGHFSVDAAAAQELYLCAF